MGCESNTYIYFNEDIIASVISRDIHYFENTVTKASGHVDYLLKLGVRGRSSREILDMSVCTID